MAAIPAIILMTLMHRLTGLDITTAIIMAGVAIPTVVSGMVTVTDTILMATDIILTYTEVAVIRITVTAGAIIMAMILTANTHTPLVPHTRVTTVRGLPTRA